MSPKCAQLHTQSVERTHKNRKGNHSTDTKQKSTRKTKTKNQQQKTTAQQQQNC